MPGTTKIQATQLKAARALLGWSQLELAKNANVAVSTIADFERGSRTPVVNNLNTIQSVLESAGITLTESGVTVRNFSGTPAPAKIGGLPIRYFDATHLDQWADRRTAQGKMPEVLSILIRASVGLAADLRFPSDDSVQNPGPDGICKIDGTVDCPYIPTGNSYWETGTDKRETVKANKDYKSRVKPDASDIDHAHSTFVFVTPRRMRHKDKWVAARRDEKIWCDIRAYDADDLVQWAELYPAAGHRIAVLVGARPVGLQQLDEVWEEWSLSTEWPMTQALVLCGRDEQEARIWRWLASPPATLTLKADSPMEAKAFLYAAIRSFPPDRANSYLARCLVTSSIDAARVLADSITPLVIVLDSIDPGAAVAFVKKGHHVFVTGSASISAAQDGDVLARPTWEAMRDELLAMGLKKPDADNLARDSARSLVVLRRLIPAAPLASVPAWAAQAQAQRFLAIMLAGGWAEQYEADKNAIERLTGEKYATIEVNLAEWLGLSDSPIRKVGGIWKIASPLDMWLRLAPSLTSEFLDRYATVAIDVLGEDNALFDVASDKRWAKSGPSTSLKHSEFLRTGLSDTLTLLAIFGEHVTAVPGAAARAKFIVKKLIYSAGARRWWSIYDQLRTLAEAAPQEFLDAVETSLDQADQPVLELFKEDEGPFGQIYHSHLLWALETLAWSRDFLAQCASILIKLAKLAPPGQYSNRPVSSLRQIFLLWFPQTYATIEERLDVLDGLRATEPDAVWQLMYDLLPVHHDVGHRSPSPRWRDFSESKPEVINEEVFFAGVSGLFDRLINDAGVNVSRWIALVRAMQRLSVEKKARVLQGLFEASRQITSSQDRKELWDALRGVLHHHRAFADAEWALPSSELDTIEKIYDALEPGDEFDTVSWLFTGPGIQSSLPNPVSTDWQENLAESNALRRRVVNGILKSRGINSVLEFARKVEMPGLVGQALTELLDDGLAFNVIELALAPGSDNADKLVAYSLIASCFHKFGDSWTEALFERPGLRDLAGETIIAILFALPPVSALRKNVVRFGRDIESKYWKKIDPHEAIASQDDLEYSINKLIAAGRARDAVMVAGYRATKVSSELIQFAMLEAVKEKPAVKPNNTEVSLFIHAVEQLMIRLDNDTSVPESDIARMEWAYFAVLEHSHCRRPRNLLRLMSADVKFFHDVIVALYHSDKSDGADAMPLTENGERIAHQAYSLLSAWNVLPGVTGNNVDAKILSGWINDARTICKESGHLGVADTHIGKMLAHAPVGSDGAWPLEAVRDIIQNMRNDDLDEGIWSGVLNNVGVTTRGMNEGGAQERARATRYRDWSKLIRIRWPRVSAVLTRIAETFEENARIEDDRSERNNW